jgi:hypothetical protein
MGIATECVELLLVYTCERGPLVPQTKIRVMLAERQTLEDIANVLIPTLRARIQACAVSRSPEPCGCLLPGSIWRGLGMRPRRQCS